MDVTTIRIRSLGELVEQITPPEPDPRTGRRRDVGVFRGTGHPDWPLLTSLDRLGGVNPPHTKCRLETHLLRNFIRYSRPYRGDLADDEWELLVAAQHHGLPTRLLDWSYSPLVAAHFATLACDGGDCAVVRLDWQRVHRAFGLPELAQSIQDLRTLGGRDDFTPWKLFERNGEHGEFACLVEPPSLDARIVMQAAAFTVCTDTSQSFDRFLERHGLLDALTRFVIPAADVDRMRDQLDLVGMGERRLFPDLDGVAAELRRYYS